MDLNTANLQSMVKLVGIDRAYDLMLWRPYLSWDEVENVPGFDAHMVEQLKAAGAEVRLPWEPRRRRDDPELRR
jgi:DNA uptake protein ComE-like DNA-binding protein